jgi:hypothetical protein
MPRGDQSHTRLERASRAASWASRTEARIYSIVAANRLPIGARIAPGPLPHHLVLQRNGGSAFNGIAWQVETGSGIRRRDVVQAMKSGGVRGPNWSVVIDLGRITADFRRCALFETDVEPASQ